MIDVYNELIFDNNSAPEQHSQLIERIGLGWALSLRLMHPVADLKFSLT